MVRRNQATFAAIGAVSVALIAGLGTSTWLFFREREARQEQVHLREESERARSSEAYLRREAEAQAKITQAAIFISRGQIAEANALMGNIDLPITHPSLEAANVFRRLADWNVTRGQWQPAANCLLKLVQANQIDKTDMTDTATRELVKVGPVLALIGDTEGYRHFTETIIAQFSGTKNPVAAEQLLKAGTILPLDQSALQPLEPIADLAEKSFADEPPQPLASSYIYAWRAFSMAQFKYRSGDFTNAILWGQKSLAYTANRPPCIAMSHAILALSFHKLNNSGAARAELASLQEMVKTSLPNGLAQGLPVGDEESGYWHDWVEAYLLLREASTDIEGPPPSLK